MNEQDRLRERIRALEKELERNDKDKDKWKVFKVEDCFMCRGHPFTKIYLEKGHYIEFHDASIRVNRGEYLAYQLWDNRSIRDKELESYQRHCRVYSKDLEYQFRIGEDSDEGYDFGSGGGSSDPRGDCRNRNLPF